MEWGRGSTVRLAEHRAPFPSACHHAAFFCLLLLDVLYGLDGWNEPYVK